MITYNVPDSMSRTKSEKTLFFLFLRIPFSRVSRSVLLGSQKILRNVEIRHTKLSRARATSRRCSRGWTMLVQQCLLLCRQRRSWCCSRLIDNIVSERACSLLCDKSCCGHATELQQRTYQSSGPTRRQGSERLFSSRTRSPKLAR